jgi:imidazolonepropionase-like amidohydrolase
MTEAATGWVLRGGTLIDGTGTAPRQSATVVISANRIESVSQQGTASGYQTLDLSGLTILPGLIDAHTHLASIARPSPNPPPAAEIAARIFRNCELALDAGFTSCREVGGVDGGMARTIELGLVRGPRIFPSGQVIVQDGGHGTLMPEFSDCFCQIAIPGLVVGYAICNSPDEVRLAARQNFRRGATQLKVMASGGVVSLTDNLDDTQLTVEEIHAAVVEAEARNTYVTAHCHNVRAIRNGLAAGITCVEHGSYLDETTAAEMARFGAALVPTLTVANLMLEEYQKWRLPDLVVPRVQGMERAMGNAIHLARKAGVRLGSGSDLLGPDQNRRGRELLLRAQVEDPMTAIRSATIENARIMRRHNDLGSIEAGKLADVIAVSGDPLSEPELFDDPSRIVLVIKDGQVQKDILNLTRGRIARPQWETATTRT